ncbi:acyl-CoA dehydrogenase family protein [Phaeobacter sp. HF9A]|uniref:acyl-CoA dehydrogenase family protein n=1 Tax=Phaeobacter sp. HF9A TaxID=2721561 RepID=UPI001430F92B|nr:acyl-CoA dehydrogenase family protein [Phaeobacter sp. HF9A]NIZ15252.1 acyl-CoA dehydrogenase [Phaeobacter sp. HF9A]
MIPFTAPADDILFSLRQIAGAAALPDWDDDTAREILTAFASFAEAEIAPLDEIGDRQGCRLEEGRVILPEGFARVYAQLADLGWQGLTAPDSRGGMAQSPLVAAMVSEVFAGANHAMQMVCNLVPGAIATLLRYGSAAQQETWIPRLASGQALSTMCMTEAGAGSDLSRVQCRATRAGEGWQITGDKIFISGGDQPMSADILHLVLARTGAVSDGIKGLSLFLTAKSMAGPAIQITRIEEKLGLHASPTCQMRFEDAPAELIGVEGEGLVAMFTLMNHARLDVSLQGVAHAARAHAIASAYAAERKQGRRADRSDAVLSDHADVRRMLNEQQSLAIGARAMAHVTLVEMQRGNCPELVDFLTPVCKVFCSEAGIRAADLGIQILGGYGYLNEYRIGQTWRDARITAIYEGANGIHALTTATRGLHLKGGAGADAFDALIGRLSDHPEVLAQRETWRKARLHVANDPAPATHAEAFMSLTGDLFYRAIWGRIAALAPSEAHCALARAILAPKPAWR